MSLEAIQLSLRYSSVDALHDISISAAPGRITAVLGPNAAGKSTLLRCLIGLLKPTAGKALLNGRPAASYSSRMLAELVSYVPQRSVVSARLTVRDVVELGRFALSVDHQRIEQALDRLELRDIENRPYPELSVGQQQRVTLARAAAQLSPTGHLILDEPTSAMDLRHVQMTMGILRELADAGATILIAMHDLILAARWADDIWLLREGRLVASGVADNTLSSDQLEGVFDVSFERATTQCGTTVLITRASNSSDV